MKKTINYDAPEVYHLYFGNEQGSPGTIITFFPSPVGRRGRIGSGQVGVTIYAVPVGALQFWEQRLAEYGISVTKGSRISEPYLSFADYDGLRIELVEREEGRSVSGPLVGFLLNTRSKVLAGLCCIAAIRCKQPRHLFIRWVWNILLTEMDILAIEPMGS